MQTAEDSLISRVHNSLTACTGDALGYKLAANPNAKVSQGKSSCEVPFKVSFVPTTRSLNPFLRMRARGNYFLVYFVSIKVSTSKMLV